MMEQALLLLRKLLLPYVQRNVETEWSVLYDALMPIHCEAKQRLMTNRGDIYFLSEGAMLKVHGTTVARIVQPGQLLFVPLQSKSIYFQTLRPSSLLLLSRETLYTIIEGHPRAIRLYDSLLDLWHEQSNERLSLLEMQKAERIALFKASYKAVYPYMGRRDIASYLSVSEEYLRKRI